MRWLNNTSLICAGPNGCMNQWIVDQKEKQNFVFHRVTSKSFAEQRAIVDIVVNHDTGDYWVLSAHQKLSMYRRERSSPSIEYSTLMNRVQVIEMNPFDPNLIAIGSSKRISLANLSNVCEECFVMNSLTTKIQSHVMSIAWHPEKENLLAFSTKEGRVGVFDMNKLGGQPVIMLPFSGKEVYSVTWVKREGSDNLEIFCTTMGKLVYYPQSGSNKHKAIVVDKFKKVTCVGLHKNYLLVGCYKGEVLICKLDADLTVSNFTSYLCNFL